MSSILKDKYIFYSYWDKDGHGINPEHLVVYSASPIFDHYNRTIYAYGGTFGPHYFGSYHGEIFNDYAENIAKGDYSSASGHGVVSYNEGEAGFGKYNISREGKTIFTVGDGVDETHHNAFELWGDGSAYIPGTLYAGRVNAYEAHYDELDIDVTYIDDLYVKQTAYINNAYVESSYNEYTYSAYADVDELHVEQTAYINNAYVESSYNEYTYSAYADIDELHTKTSYTDNAYVGDLHVEQTAYINNAYVESSYNEYTYSAYADIDELHVEQTAYIHDVYVDNAYFDELHTNTAYINNAYVESSYNEYTYSAYADIDELHTKTSYTDNAYVGENAYVGKNLWVKRLDDSSYTNAAFAFSRMVRMFPLSDQTPEGFYNGKHYIWVGTEIELPREEDRYANVIYIVLDEAPSQDLPVFDDDTVEDIVFADHGEVANILYADDGNPEASSNPILRYD